jgi:hypothetical protein
MASTELVPWFAWAAPSMLFVMGLGFLVANVKLVIDLLRYHRRKRRALLVWQAAKPRLYGLSLALGVVLGLLIFVKLFVLHRPPQQLFGEAMMFVYFGYALPLSTRILRGFYRLSALGPHCCCVVARGRTRHACLGVACPIACPTPRGTRAPVRRGAAAAPGQGQDPRHPHRGHGVGAGEPPGG